jgi:hypothetical protein
MAEQAEGQRGVEGCEVTPTARYRYRETELLSTLHYIVRYVYPSIYVSVSVHLLSLISH